MAVRLAHFSDIHVTARPLGWKRRDVLSKKVAGWINVRFLGRGYRFRHAVMLTKLLFQEITQHPPDHLIFSGDATKLSFPNEFRRATEHIPFHALPPGLAVPGNHDRYTKFSAREALFEKAFASWQHGRRIEGHYYPFAQKVGDYWLIAANSAQATFWTWDSSGYLGDDQLERLVELGQQLDGPKILVTHYPLVTARFKREFIFRRLRDQQAALEAAQAAGIGLWLHGHIHRGFFLPAQQHLPFPVICSGSATQSKRWMYNRYELQGDVVTATRRRYNPQTHQYEPAEEFTVKLANY